MLEIRTTKQAAFYFLEQLYSFVDELGSLRLQLLMRAHMHNSVACMQFEII